MKIDRRKTYGILFDSETANGLEDALCYDMCWQIIDTHGNKYASRGYINRDVFVNMKDLMQSAYYADKIPYYWEMVKNGKRKITTMTNIIKALRKDIKDYDIKFICAHNARFDYHAMNTTQRYLTKSKYRFVLPYGIEWYDTMKMAKKVVANMPTYRRFCEENGYMTKHKVPRVRLTAEVLYRFISKDNDFVEEHMGLEDVDIERQIFQYCRNTKRISLSDCKAWN